MEKAVQKLEELGYKKSNIKGREKKKIKFRNN
jgi:hypothetical protein